MKRAVHWMAAVAVIGVLGIGVSVALAQDVMVNYVPGTDFSKYKTCKRVEIQGAEKPDQIIDTQIKQAIDKAMAKLLKDFPPKPKKRGGPVAASVADHGHAVAQSRGRVPATRPSSGREGAAGVPRPAPTT